ncbi:MAG: nitroreductase family protein [Lactobacillus sp.]|nr:nitroreductase family protein [Lactobacillus sp.]
MTDAVLKRVAIRKYTAEKVSAKDIDKLIAAFQAAPCGMHQADVMQMTVVEDENLLSEIEQVTSNACYNAPLLFIINVKKGNEFGERDASVAAENLMVEAAELNLGSVYLMNAASVLNSAKSLEEKLGVPTDFETSVIVACGHAAEQPNDDRSNRYKVVRK